MDGVVILGLAGALLQRFRSTNDLQCRIREHILENEKVETERGTASGQGKCACKETTCWHGAQRRLLLIFAKPNGDKETPFDKHRANFQSLVSFLVFFKF